MQPHCNLQHPPIDVPYKGMQEANTGQCSCVAYVLCPSVCSEKGLGTHTWRAWSFPFWGTVLLAFPLRSGAVLQCGEKPVSQLGLSRETGLVFKEQFSVLTSSSLLATLSWLTAGVAEERCKPTPPVLLQRTAQATWTTSVWNLNVTASAVLTQVNYSPQLLKGCIRLSSRAGWLVCTDRSERYTICLQLYTLTV